MDKLDEVLFVQHLPKEWQQKVKDLQAAGVPDKKVAKMISQTQTAKKGETRQALLAAAGENAAEKLDAHQLKDKKSKGDSLDNPFLNTEAAAGLGAPLMNERTQKIALAAQAADPNDESAAKLLAKAKNARIALKAQEKASSKAVVDIREPAPSMDEIVESTTLEASSTIQSPDDTVAVPSETSKTVEKKPVAKKAVAKKTAPKKTSTKKTVAKKKPTKKSTKSTSGKATSVASKKATSK